LVISDTSLQNKCKNLQPGLVALYVWTENKQVGPIHTILMPARACNLLLLLMEHNQLFIHQRFAIC